MKLDTIYERLYYSKTAQTVIVWRIYNNLYACLEKIFSLIHGELYTEQLTIAHVRFLQ